MKRAGDEKPERTHAWRDNIEAVTMAVIMAVLLKYFVVEAYKIPTGSMQPTLMGNEETGIFDRILVDKLSYHFRDPERFEIVVFRYPLDRSKNFIKRIWGMPGEELEIRHGDIFHRQGDGEWRILRRPRTVQRTAWRQLSTEGEWSFGESYEDWTTDGDDVVAGGPGSAVFPRGANSVVNGYTDGYPPKMAALISPPPRGRGPESVADLRLETRLVAAEGCEEIVLSLREGLRRYHFHFPAGTDSDAAPRIEVVDATGRIEDLQAVSAKPWSLRPGEGTSVAVQNMNDLLQLEIDDEIVLQLEIPASSDQRAGITLTAKGMARFEDARAYRDTYYTSAGSSVTRWKVPEDCYVMLGDNSQDSSDSREWQLASFQLGEGEYEDTVVRGNDRAGENPRVVGGGPDGPETFFVDEYGERWVFPRRSAQRNSPIQASFVPRELITGRALLVFWPLVPSLDVYRLKWIH